MKTTISKLFGIAAVVGLCAFLVSPSVQAACTDICGKHDDKTQICHVPPGNPDQPQTLCISDRAVDAHLDNHPEDCVASCECCLDGEGCETNEDCAGTCPPGGIPTCVDGECRCHEV